MGSEDRWLRGDSPTWESANTWGRSADEGDPAHFLPLTPAATATPTYSYLPQPLPPAPIPSGE